ncbi:unnamed protein product [Symbiodinium sp. CCMP2592]|nr:unnamed protein product [Symbiodinium sp. CCMP2592]
MLRQIAAERFPLSHAHVKAHSGHVANELCDEAAKRTRRCQLQCSGDLLPVWPGRLFAHPLKAWAWLPPTGTVDMPTLFSFESEAFRLQRQDLLPTTGPSLGLCQGRPGRGPVSHHIRLVTANILTLLDPRSGQPQPASCESVGMRVVAKREVIKKQFLEAGVLLVGLQETRLQHSAVLPDSHFVMLHAGANSLGHFGVALWVNTSVPYAKWSDTPRFFEKGHFTVTAAEPRLLVVQVRAPGALWTIVVAHGPSEPPSPEGTAADFWGRCAHVVGRRPQGSAVIVLADAKAHVGSLPSDSIGPLAPEEENSSGAAFHEFLARLELWAPSTFPECHYGASHTWLSPFGPSHRLDFIGIPIAWPAASASSHVWEDFEHLQVKDDHLPLVLELGFEEGSRPAHAETFRRRAVRPPRMHEPPGAYVQALQHFCDSPQASWSAPIDAHYLDLIKTWRAEGQALCPAPQARRPFQTYLSGPTLQLVEWRKAWRVHVRAVRRQANARRLAFGFLSWQCLARGVAYSRAQADGLYRRVRLLDTDIAQAAHMIASLGRQIKQATRSDRATYLSGLAEAVSLADLRDPRRLYEKVRKAFPSAKASRRSSFQPLPAVQTAEGRLACSHAEREECWRSHFAEQEAGEVVDSSSYIAILRDQKTRGRHASPVFEIGSVPTLAGVEQTIVGLPAGKAAGYDGITGELLRVHAPSSARLLLAVYTKSALGISEPLEFRGGSLLPLAKKAGSVLACEGFRSILISSIPGKIMHRQFRNQLLGPLQTVASELQAGALPGVSTEAVAMTARTFRDIARSLRLTTALTVFDIRAAYYRVLRQVLTRVDDTDWAFRRLMHDVGVPPEALAELEAKLRGIGVLAEAGTPEHLRRMLADALQGTWFRLDTCAILTMTHRGVRPGDCLADVLFAFSFSAYMAAAEARLRELGLATDLPSASDDSLTAVPVVQGHLTCASWADDFVHMASAAKRCLLVPKVVRCVQVFLEQAEVAGIRLTFARDKTATLLEDEGEGDPLVLRDAEGSYLEVRSAVTSTCVRLPIVSAYRHLGGIVTASGTPAPEVHYRHSLAAGVIRPLKAKLFAAPGIPLATRALLLRSLAVSRFTFGSAAIVLTAAIHSRLWARLYVSVWRSLWKRGKGDPTLHSYEVLRRVAAPPPPLALALARAVFLRQLVKAGPAPLLHLLRVQWQGTLLTSSCTFLSLLVSSLLELVWEKPAWWVATVKRACKCAQADLEKWRVDKDRHEHSGPAPAPVRPRDSGAFACQWCGARFPMRKHLGAHLAKSHGIFSPARHLAFGDTCISCLTCYHSVSRVQAHLKHSDHCLRRSCLLAPPLTVPQIREVEAQETKARKRVKHGHWAEYSATLPAMRSDGPKGLTAAERIDICGEDLDLATLSRLHRPQPSFLSWIDAFIADRSREGPRSGTASFWHSRPAFHPNSA